MEIRERDGPGKRAVRCSKSATTTTKSLKRGHLALHSCSRSSNCGGRDDDKCGISEGKEKAAPACAPAETAEEWIALGARVHGGFGAFIPLGIKIGLDAVDKLHAKPRELTVLSALTKLALMNKDLDPRGRYDAVMTTDTLFQVEPAP